MAMLLTACSGIQIDRDEQSLERATIQVATLRVVSNSDSITAADVVDRVETARSILDGEQLVSLDDIAAAVVTTDEWQRLDPIDRSYLALLFRSIQDEAETGVDHVLGPGDRERLSIVLDWIEEAASHAVDADHDKN